MHVTAITLIIYWHDKMTKAHRWPIYHFMMIRVFTRKAAPWMALILSGGLLLGAWIFQYGLGYAPCTMCYWQRHAHKAVIGLAILTLVLRRLGQNMANTGFKGSSWETALIGSVIIGLIGSAALGGFHMGVENKWWDGPKSCSGGGLIKLPEINPDDPLAMLDIPISGPSCSDAVWHFIGLSMAAWNAILSLGGAIIVFAAHKIDIKGLTE